MYCYFRASFHTFQTRKLIFNIRYGFWTKSEAEIRTCQQDEIRHTRRYKDNSNNVVALVVVVMVAAAVVFVMGKISRAPAIRLAIRR